MPDKNDPNYYGLHENAAISSAIFDTNFIINLVLQVDQGSGSADGKGRSKELMNSVKQILKQVPPLFDLKEAKEKHPISYHESMNTVLAQEILRYNNLISLIKKTLEDLKLALDGQIIMSEVLETMADSILINQIPDIWKKSSFASLKNLGRYIIDLLDRVAMFKSWMDHGVPLVFWVSGFFFTQSFFTGVLQNYARKNDIPIDK